ncbi:MAG: rhodoquinone biosynthesis methyltransferase RquA [Bdellovibrionales bacterium]
MQEDTLNPESRILNPNLSIPDYLEKTYWWAYVRPWAVRLFERDWLINLILWGWYEPLRDRVLAAMGDQISGKTLKISCCYGALEPMLAQRVHAGQGRLDIIDVAPEQLKNARRKIPEGLEGSVVNLYHRDACDLGFADNSYDRALIFFLPHEQPEGIRRQTFAEAFRVVRKGGEIYVAEFNRCAWWHPLKYIWHTALYVLEPYAPPLWKKELSTWMPDEGRGCRIEKTSLFGGFYQIVKITL